MLKLSPCIEMMWNDIDFVKRIPRAAALGYKAFEFWSWWDKDVDAIEKAAKDAGLEVAASCVQTAFTSKTAAPLLLPEGKAGFVEAVKESIKVAPRLNCKTFIVTTGNELPNVPRDAQRKACVEALKAAAPVVEDAGITLVLEALNVLVDHKGYYLSTSAEGFEILDEVGSSAVKLLFDIYHMQIDEGNITRNICDNIGKIGHFHVANNPGRHEPAIGEINYPFLLRKIREAGYERYVGLEFSPSDPARTDEILKEVLILGESA